MTASVVHVWRLLKWGRILARHGALRDLEAIVHPAVRPRILGAIERAQDAGARAVVIEAIKLVEGGLAELCDEVRDAAEVVSYGWGMVPVSLRLGETSWTTSLWPREGGYIVPLKDAVRAAEGVELGDVVTVRLTIALER